jgi:hypothetical protein
MNVLCLRISEYFLTPRQECSGAEHFSRMTCVRVTDADSVMGSWSGWRTSDHARGCDPRGSDSAPDGATVRHGGLRRGGDVKHYFDESFRQLTTATTIPISAVIGPVMDQVVVLLIWLPPSTPNPWSAQIRPNTATINPTVNVTTKVLLI